MSAGTVLCIDSRCCQKSGMHAVALSSVVEEPWLEMRHSCHQKQEESRRVMRQAWKHDKRQAEVVKATGGERCRRVVKTRLHEFRKQASKDISS